MKRKIGELRNIPIVEGDKNLVREGTEIHINDLQSKGGSSSGGSKMEYYKLNKEKYGAEENSPLNVLYTTSFFYPSIVKLNDGDTLKSCAPMALIVSLEQKLSKVIGFWEGIAFDPNIKTSVVYPGEGEYNCNNLQELIKYLETSQGMSWKDDALIPITEEEFYNLN